MKSKQKKQVSYYDTKNREEFLRDPKSLSKIRSKNLKDFCEFCLFVESTPLIAFQNNSNETGKVLGLLHGFKGANAFFLDKKERENPELKNLIQNFKIKWNNRRTIYDYMNAYKFIKATRGYGQDKVLDIFMNATKKEEKI